MERRRVEYPISPKYVPDWGVREALREIIANALDTDTVVNHDWDGGLAEIEDEGPGIRQDFWVLGEGAGGAIGQFHEGMKLAALTLAREGRGVEFETVGYSVSPSIQYSETYQADVLCLDFSPSNRTHGTITTIECSQEELQEAISLFRIFSPPPVLDDQLGILEAPGQVYITGVYVQKIESFWGYDFSEKSFANRDRSVLDMSGMRHGILDKLSMLTSESMMKKFLEGAMNPELVSKIEFGLYVTPQTVKMQTLWKKSFHSLLGHDACLSSRDPDIDERVKAHGNPVIYLPDSVAYLFGSAGVQNATDIIRKMARTTFVWPKDKLSETEQRILDQAKRIAKKAVPDTEVGQTRVVEQFPELDGGGSCCTEGLYRSGIVYLRRDVLRPEGPGEEMKALKKATGILIHERLHGQGHHDKTLKFEYAMTLLLGVLAVQLAS